MANLYDADDEPALLSDGWEPIPKTLLPTDALAVDLAAVQRGVLRSSYLAHTIMDTVVRPAGPGWPEVHVAEEWGTSYPGDGVVYVWSDSAEQVVCFHFGQSTGFLGMTLTDKDETTLGILLRSEYKRDRTP